MSALKTADLKLRAQEKAESMNWPDASMEEWRRTNPRQFRLRFDAYKPVTLESGPKTSTQIDENLSARIVFEAGSCVEFSRSKELESLGVELEVLDAETFYKDESLSSMFEKRISDADNKVRVNHYAQLSHGYLLKVPADITLEKPVEIIFREKADGAVFPHGIVKLGQSAKATVIQRIESLGKSEFLSLGSDLVLGANAQLDFTQIQALDSESRFFSYTNVDTGNDAVLKIFDAALGGKLVKTRIDSFVLGSGVDIHMNGIYFAKDGQHMDISTGQNHMSANSVSKAFYKGALKKGGRTVFSGMINVTPEGTGTDAYLTNRNLLLEKGARADSIPMLNINTNDLKCSHGSTTGKLNRDEIFYLQSRGYSREEAVELLVLAFFDELILQAPQAAQEVMQERILALWEDRA
jgi:Fe-S cluster assembly protein SufD